jgi:hypothetical protein
VRKRKEERRTDGGGCGNGKKSIGVPDGRYRKGGRTLRLTTIKPISKLEAHPIINRTVRSAKAQPGPEVGGQCQPYIHTVAASLALGWSTDHRIESESITDKVQFDSHDNPPIVFQHYRINCSSCPPPTTSDQHQPWESFPVPSISYRHAATPTGSKQASACLETSFERSGDIMAKKKKGGGGGGAAPKRDARGYGQQQPTTPSTSSGVSSTLRVTTATQSHLDQVLVSMEDHDPSSSTTNAAAAAAGTGAGADVGPSDRFVKRLSNVYDRLKEASFMDEPIERAIVALGYNVTLESALDYLCLHLSAAELPPLFTEGSVRDDLASTSSSAALEVIVPQPNLLAVPSDRNSNEVDDASSPVPLTTMPLVEDDDDDNDDDDLNRTEEEDGAAHVGASEDGPADANNATTTRDDANKEWILRQYRDYCSDNDDDNDNENQNNSPESDDGRGQNVSEDADTSRACRQGTSGEPRSVDGTDGEDDSSVVRALAAEKETCAARMSEPEPAKEEKPEEEEEDDPVLRALRVELEQVQADVNDDASNYLRSKHEIREIKRQCQQLQKRVADMERAAQQRARKTRMELPMENNDRISVVDPLPSSTQGEEDEDGGGGGGMLDLFDEDAATTVRGKKTSPNASEPAVVQPPSMDFPADALKSWTGKTPRQLLHEHCTSKKHGLWLQPKYAMSGNKCTVTVKPAKGDRPPMHAELVGLFRSSSHDSVMAKEYVATKLLYAVQSDRPLYRVLPPYFADLWKAWHDAETKVELHAKNQVKDERSRNIQRLLDLVASTANARPAVESNDEVVPVNSSSARSSAMNYHSARRSKDGDTRGAAAESVDDTRLHQMFLDRRTTSAYQKMLRERSALPIFSFRDRILECVRVHPVTVLSAETGAGKSTNCGQVREILSSLTMRSKSLFSLPHQLTLSAKQFLLEDAFEAGRFASILCTQPRRVAATSVAERVAEEMGEASVGRLVGYQIRLESRKSNDTRLLFCTTGVVRFLSRCLAACAAASWFVSTSFAYDIGAQTTCRRSEP